MSTQEDIIIKEKPKEKTKRPNLWSVKFYNDDFTPMDFVVYVLVDVLRLGIEEAANIMLKVHKEGAAVVGLYPRDIAETKAHKIMDLAKAHQHPLKVEAVVA